MCQYAAVKHASERVLSRRRVPTRPEVYRHSAASTRLPRYSTVSIHLPACCHAGACRHGPKVHRHSTATTRLSHVLTRSRASRRLRRISRQPRINTSLPASRHVLVRQDAASASTYTAAAARCRHPHAPQRTALCWCCLTARTTSADSRPTRTDTGPRARRRLSVWTRPRAGACRHTAPCCLLRQLARVS